MSIHKREMFNRWTLIFSAPAGQRNAEKSGIVSFIIFAPLKKKGSHQLLRL